MKVALTILFIYFFSTIGFSQESPRLIINSQGHLGIVNELIFSKNGDKLISISEDKTIRIWNVETGESIRVIRPFASSGFEGRLYSAALSPDDRFLAIGGYFKDNEIRIIDLNGSGVVTILKGHSNIVTSLTFNAKGNLLASAGADNTLILWEVQTENTFNANIIQVFNGHTSPIYDVQFFPDGNNLVTASLDGSLRLWNVTQKEASAVMKMHIDKVYSLSISKNGNFIASGGNKGDIIIWRSDGTYVRTLKEVSGQVTCLNFDKNDQLIVGSNNLGVFKSVESTLFNNITGSESNITALTNYNNIVAISYGANGIIQMVDLESKKLIKQFESPVETYSKIGLADDLKIAVGNKAFQKVFDLKNLEYLFAQTDIKNIHVAKHEENGYQLQLFDRYTLSTGFKGNIANHPRIDGPILSYHIIDDNLIGVGSEYSMKIYDRNGVFQKNLEGHNGSIINMITDNSNQYLIASCSDYVIRVWNIKSGDLLVSLFISDDNEWIIWDKNGYYDASAGGEKYLGWQIDYTNNKLSKFYTSNTFQKTHFRKDIIKDIMRTGEKYSSVDASQTTIKTPEFEKVPIIKWISPVSYESNSNERIVTIKASVISNSKLELIRIIVNGRPLPNQRGSATEVNAQNGVVIIEEKISLINQVNEVKILVKNSSSKAISESRFIFTNNHTQVGRDKSESLQIIDVKDKGDFYLLSIGVSNFENDTYNLGYADIDAKSITELFTPESNTAYSTIKTKTLINSDASKNNILDSFKWLLSNAKPQDVACIYIASHGFNEDGDFYILPYDGNMSNLENSAVKWSDLSLLMASLPSKVLVFLDACHSGKLGANFNTFKSENTEALREASSDETGVVIMSASTGNETALESEEWGHGAFSLSIIEGLKLKKADFKKDGIIYLNELDLYVSDRTIELTNGQQHPTTQKPSTISRLIIQ